MSNNQQNINFQTLPGQIQQTFQYPQGYTQQYFQQQPQPQFVYSSTSGQNFLQYQQQQQTQHIQNPLMHQQFVPQQQIVYQQPPQQQIPVQQPSQPKQQVQTSAKPQVQQSAQKSTDIRAQLKAVYDKIPLSELEDQFGEVTPIVSVMNSLLKYESAIDQMIKRKRNELQEQFIQPQTKQKNVLRLIIYNEIFQNTSDDNAYCSLFIKGKILDNENVTNKMLSQYFKQIDVNFDKNILAQNYQVSWQRQSNITETNSFEIRKPLLCNEMQVEIFLHPLQNPQKYKLNKNLQQILGFQEATRSQILSSFWEYIKLNGLQDKENKEFIIADENLKQIFHQERIYIGHLNMHLKVLLENPDPISIKHTIRLTDTPQNSIQGWDILVEDYQNYNPELMPFLASKVVTEDNVGDRKNARTEHPFMLLNQKVKSYDKQIQKLTEEMKSQKSKRDQYLAYAKNPSEFLENILLQQNAQLEIIHQESSWKSENPKKLKFLLKNKNIVEKQIRKYLEQKEENPLQQTIG